ncbi:MAG: peptide-methionine (S)-S-oxide reductase MsrA [Candidatus Diapherotrites archaeon]|nr:peptide-methionine (S)-S-oxide reductase MsrA [Candidatus Diapherotrites archaeon]
MASEKIMFGAGCFWGVEAAFREVDGVIDVSVGYSGGKTKNPSYPLVCTGLTGHAEVVLVEFDPKRVSLEKLLGTFWHSHDPTQLNRQGPDVGHQYRSAIFYYSDAQKKTAENSKADLQKQIPKPIVTEILPAGEFWRAEEYHQRYSEKHPGAVC